MLKVGVVGVGIGGGHGAAIHKSGVAELAAVCDKDAARLKWRLETYAKEIGLLTRGYTDFEEMLRREKLDGVLICTPSGVHHEQAVLAAQHGVPMLIEKPMEITRAHMDAIQAAVAKAGVPAGVHQSMRYSGVHWALKQAVDRGDFGRLLLADARLKFYREQSYYDKGGWRATWAMDGGGALMNQGVHMIDFLTWLAGPARRVRADFAALNHKIETEDWAAGVAEFASGVRSSFSSTTCVFPKIDRVDVDVHGTAGTARLAGGAGVETNIASLQNPAPAPFPSVVLDFLDAIQHNRPPAVSLEEARRPVELILAAYDSARRGQTVEIA